MHNDFALAPDSVGAKCLWIVMLISANLPFGPHKNSERWHEQRDFLKHYYEHSASLQCPTFQRYAGDIYRSLTKAGHEFPGVDPAREVLAYLKQRGKSVNKGRRTDLCRFMDSRRAAKRMLSEWPILEFERTLLGLGNDFSAAGSSTSCWSSYEKKTWQQMMVTRRRPRRD